MWVRLREEFLSSARLTRQARCVDVEQWVSERVD